MNDGSNNDFELVDQIESDAYLFFLIVCCVCEKDLPFFELGIREPEDPMIQWAKDFSKAAKSLGWSVSSTGGIFCKDCKELL